MLASGDSPATIDATTIEVIAERVTAALHDDLEALAAKLVGAASPGEQLSVEQVALRLGVARSTVYTHWREWGGYKLGAGEKAPIRFDSSALPIERPSSESRQTPSGERPSTPAPQKRRRADLLSDAPRLEGSRTGSS